MHHEADDGGVTCGTRRWILRTHDLREVNCRRCLERCKRPSPPAEGPSADREDLQVIRERLATQDTFLTRDPICTVQEKVKDWGVEEDYQGDLLEYIPR